MQEVQGHIVLAGPLVDISVALRGIGSLARTTQHSWTVGTLAKIIAQLTNVAIFCLGYAR